MDKATIRRMEVRRRAKDFAMMVRESNMAHKLGDELIDWLKDEEFEQFDEYLRRFRLIRRPDGLWEERR